MTSNVVAVQENAFSTKNAYMEWEIIESRQEPKQIAFNQLPERTRDVVKCLMVIGVIGSAQLKSIFLNNKKKNLAVLKQLDIILEHKFYRDGEKDSIPIYTLGRTGLFLQKQLGGSRPLNYWIEFSVNQVMDCIVTYQLFGHYRRISHMELVDNTAYTPFKAEFSSPTPKGNVDYAIGVIRDAGDVSKFSNFFRIGQNVPAHLVFITTNIQLMMDIVPIIKPFIHSIRVVVDKDLKFDKNKDATIDNQLFFEQFKNMFYRYDMTNNIWTK